MKNLAIRGGLIGVVLAGGLILRPFLTGNAGDLAVGECFDPPAATVQEVEDVQHRPCTEAHGGEVFYVGGFPDGENVDYPSDAAWEAHVTATCVPAFNTYTGLDYMTDPDWDFGYFVPTADGWEGGDHEVLCYAIRIDEEPTSVSIKAGG